MASESTPEPRRSRARSGGGDGTGDRPRSDADRGTRTGFVQFARECAAELRKVQWPTREALWSATAVVLIVTIIVGLYIFGLDTVLVRASEWLIDLYAEY